MASSGEGAVLWGKVEAIVLSLGVWLPWVICALDPLVESESL
ncbi:MAG: hypothetical protein ACO37W_02420 [Prochlorotrichaceae cyanobacterium]